MRFIDGVSAYNDSQRVKRHIFCSTGNYIIPNGIHLVNT